jgi:hypothetical protein
MFRQLLAQSPTWINPAAVDSIAQDADGSYTVTMRGGEQFTGVDQAQLELTFPQFIGPPPPVEPIPIDPPYEPMPAPPGVPIGGGEPDEEVRE